MTTDVLIWRTGTHQNPWKCWIAHGDHGANGGEFAQSYRDA
jgi:hypothetical protein